MLRNREVTTLLQDNQILLEIFCCYDVSKALPFSFFMGMAPAVDWMGTFGNAFDMFITEFCIPNKSVTLIKEKMLLIYV